uniref:Transcription initiation factor TFIID subunit 8 n=1 Tax=Daphnia galeata TaxID=27404 RepID=A0A8J2WFZ7_9CRUS|nr:unnamed protein product [Daphnia galeata]
MTTNVSEPVMSGAASRRKLLQASVSCLCSEAGFSAVDELSLETLTEMMQSFLTELGHSSRLYCELSARVEPVVGDVVMALVSMGIKHNSLESYAQRARRLVLPTPTQAVATKQIGILQTGQKRPHPSHIPDHLPAFPDSHAYVQTPTHKQPQTDYETIREKASCQKRDVERALTRFVAKTGETQSFFLVEDLTHYPLIACKPMDKPFLSALLPRDQTFEEDEAAVHMQKQEEANAEAIKAAKLDQEKENNEMMDNLGPNGSLMEMSNSEPFIMENPFIRPVKMPLSKKKSSP